MMGDGGWLSSWRLAQRLSKVELGGATVRKREGSWHRGFFPVPSL